MSGKRQATSELNHDNWDEPEEPEERGTFRSATADELKGRIIKKARRTIAATSGADNADAAPKSVFGGFSGFGKTAPAAASSSPFSFLSKLPVASSVGASGSSNATPMPTFSFGGANANKGKEPAPSTDSKKADIGNGSLDGKSNNYYAKLKTLNQSVSEWIKTHVDKDPICILTPIFKDYEKHLNTIEKEENNKSTSGDTKISLSFAQSSTSNTTTSSPGALSGFKFSTTPAASSAASSAVSSTTTTSATPMFSFGSTSSPFGTATSQAASGSPKSTNTTATSIFGNAAKTTATTSSEPQKTNGFSFGLKSDAKPATSSGFSFGTPASTSFGSTDNNNKPITSGFSLAGGVTPSFFANIQPPPASSVTASNKSDEDDEDQPPKVEFKQVVEEDAVYSKKCKVFVKKDNNFADRGVGTLYLKPIKDGEKTQLLVRADTNLGNILVNLILSPAIPVQRMGKNNVMMVCLPTPDAEKPTSMLLRVKTGEEADELLATIEKHTK